MFPLSLKQTRNCYVKYALATILVLTQFDKQAYRHYLTGTCAKVSTVGYDMCEHLPFSKAAYVCDCIYQRDREE